MPVAISSGVSSFDIREGLPPEKRLTRPLSLIAPVEATFDEDRCRCPLTYFDSAVTFRDRDLTASRGGRTDEEAVPTSDATPRATSKSPLRAGNSVSRRQANASA